MQESVSSTPKSLCIFKKK